MANQGLGWVEWTTERKEMAGEALRCLEKAANLAVELGIPRTEVFQLLARATTRILNLPQY